MKSSTRRRGQNLETRGHSEGCGVTLAPCYKLGGDDNGPNDNRKMGREDNIDFSLFRIYSPRTGKSLSRKFIIPNARGFGSETQRWLCLCSQIALFIFYPIYSKPPYSLFYTYRSNPCQRSIFPLLLCLSFFSHLFEKIALIIICVGVINSPKEIIFLYTSYTTASLLKIRFSNYFFSFLYSSIFVTWKYSNYFKVRPQSQKCWNSVPEPKISYLFSNDL